MGLLDIISVQRVLAALGALSVLPFTYRLSRSLYIYGRPSSLPRYKRQDAYALITGASDGIGRGFARALAKDGFNLVLHGRNETKLSAVKTELKSNYPNVDIRLLIIDASASHGMKASIESATAALSDLPGPLTIIVNNAGGAGAQSNAYLPLEDITHAEVDGVLNLNARFPVQLTRALLPRLLKSQPALLLNISSGAASFPMPFLPVYSATKAFGGACSMSMARTLRSQGHDVLAQDFITGKVCGTSHNKNTGSLFEPNGDVFARACLNRVGCGKMSMAPYWPQALQMWFMSLLPDGMATSALISAIEGEKKLAAERPKQS